MADMAAGRPKNMANSLVEPSFMRTHRALLMTNAYEDGITLSMVCATALQAADDGQIANGSKARPPSQTCSMPLQKPTVIPPGNHSHENDSTNDTSGGSLTRSWKLLTGNVESRPPPITTTLFISSVSSTPSSVLL
jgi:hypothetical protein